MGLIYKKPTSPGQRGTILVDKSHLWKGKPEKSLVRGKKSTGGRITSGKLTVRSRGGGHKRKLRMVDFHRKESTHAEVLRLEHDPGRTGFIALVQDTITKRKSYVLAPDKIKAGDFISTGNNSEIAVGNSMELRAIPVGTEVHNLEITPKGRAKMVRSAGTCARISGRDGLYVLVKLPSGEIRKFLGECKATIGIVSNADNKNVNIGKAGRNRWKGIRPHVRGVAMNPVDHPMGGGEGKSSGGRQPISWAGRVLSKGQKTRSKKKSNRLIVAKRRR